MANTIRIKRSTSTAAPSTLANAELAYSENSSKLFIGVGTGGAGGSATSIVAIGGSGAYATLDTAQTISGNKTFTGTIDLTGATVAGFNTTGNVTIGGDLTVNGTTTTVNSTTVTVDDKNIELGSTASPSDAGADGGGLTLKGTTDKTLIWYDATDSWTFNQNLELTAGNVFRIDGAQVLSKTALGSGVLSSSLTSVGTISTGTWQGSTVSVAYGGTGATTLTGYVKGNGTGAMTAAATIPNTDITGLGTISTQSASNVNITGGAIDGITFDGGTF